MLFLQEGLSSPVKPGVCVHILVTTATIWNVFGWTRSENGKMATVRLQFHGWGFKVKGGLLLRLPRLSLSEQRTAATPISFAVV